LFLGSALVREELDVVDEQQVERVVIPLEFIEGLLLVGAHHVGNVLFRVAVADARLGPYIGKVVADGLKQMRLSKTYAAVDEQRVVGNSRVRSYLDRGGTRQLICLAGHQAFEGEVPV